MHRENALATEALLYPDECDRCLLLPTGVNGWRQEAVPG
jgi:hypothetical protein